MQARAIQAFCRAGQVALALALVLVKDGRSCEAVPEGVPKEFLQFPLGVRRNRAMAFIHDKGDAHAMQTFCRRRVLFLLPMIGLHDLLQLLYRGDDDDTIFVLELFQKIMGIVCLIHINDVVLGVGLEG